MPYLPRAAHEEAHRQAEQRMGERWPFSDDHGPQLLEAYGGSIWRNNVALVQTTAATLDSLWSQDAQTGETRLARPDLLQLGFDHGGTQYSVDRDSWLAWRVLPMRTAATQAATSFQPPRHRRTGRVSCGKRCVQKSPF